ncbi:MAG: hypothetical protein ACK5BN_00455 [Planctomycetota bacterium]
MLTLHSGKTVEINNTDAEGRLLLADGVDAAELRAQQRVAGELAHGDAAHALQQLLRRRRECRRVELGRRHVDEARRFARAADDRLRVRVDRHASAAGQREAGREPAVLRLA